MSKRPNNNYQDEAMEREYDKGERNGSNKGRGGRGNSNRNGSRKPNKPRNGGKATVGIDNRESSNNVSWHHPSNMPPNTYSVFSHQYDMSMPTQIWPNGSFYTRDGGENIVIPGIMRMDVMPVLGSNGFVNSALNLAGLDLYQTLQAANNRAPQYEYTDLTMNIIATGSLYACFKWFTRGLGFTRDFSNVNRYKPQTLVNAMNLNFDELKSNKSNIISELNIFVDALNSLYVPRTVDYIERQIWLYDNVYMDSNSPKAQLYFLQPTGFWKFVEGSTTNPLSHLEFVDLIGNDAANANGRQTQLTSETVLNMLWDLYYALANSTDVQNMAADMRKAFGDGGTYQVTPLSLDFKFEPVYDQVVLSQFENAYIGLPINGEDLTTQLDWQWSPYWETYKGGSNIFGAVYVNPDINAGFIQVDMGYIPAGAERALIPGSNGGYNNMGSENVAWLFDPVFTEQVNYLINFHKDDPTAEDVVEATRLSAFFADTPYVVGTQKLTARITGDYATEIITGAYLYVASTQNPINSKNGVVVVPFSSYYAAGIAAEMQPAGSSREYFSNPISALGLIEAFDWHPRVYYFDCGNGRWPYNYGSDGVLKKNEDWIPVGNINLRYHALDYETYVVIGKENMYNMNRIDLLGQFEPVARKVRGRINNENK